MKRWPGIFKVIEEAAEVQQILSKLAAFPSGRHPTGVHLPDLALEEIADLYAALSYFMECSQLEIDQARYERKLNTFETWGLAGVDDGEETRDTPAAKNTKSPVK